MLVTGTVIDRQGEHARRIQCDERLVCYWGFPEQRDIRDVSCAGRGELSHGYGRKPARHTEMIRIQQQSRIPGASGTGCTAGGIRGICCIRKAAHHEECPEPFDTPQSLSADPAVVADGPTLHTCGAAEPRQATADDRG